MAAVLLMSGFQTAGVPAQANQGQQHEHQAPAAGAQPDMPGMHARMMADMKAADQRLDALVAKMNSASGQAKVDAVAAVVNELVTQRTAMQEMMASCPMMQNMGGMKH
jgi:hypothetical protein